MKFYKISSVPFYINKITDETELKNGFIGF